MDDSGTRAPDRKPQPYKPGGRDFFALGGILINEEDEGSARKLYDDFCGRWSISYPLHSVEIRHSSHNFSWLRRNTADYQRFMHDVTRLLTSMNVVGLACVIDRPGYDARYRKRYWPPTVGSMSDRILYLGREGSEVRTKRCTQITCDART